MRYIPVRRVFNTFVRPTTLGAALIAAGDRRAVRMDKAFTREPSTTTLRWKEVA